MKATEVLVRDVVVHDKAACAVMHRGAPTDQRSRLLRRASACLMTQTATRVCSTVAPGHALARHCPRSSQSARSGTSSMQYIGGLLYVSGESTNVCCLT